MEKNLYEILNVSRYASKEEVEKKYKILSKKYNEELKNNDDKIRREKNLSIIKNAYEILSDDKKRVEYDKFLKEKEDNKRIIEENIRSINDTDLEKNINEVFEMSDEITLPEIEEVSKEEALKSKEEEKIKEESNLEYTKKENKKTLRKKVIATIIIILTITLVIIALRIAMFLIVFNDKTLDDDNIENSLEIKTLQSGERLPSEILLNKNIKNDFYETHIEMDLSYCEEYDVYYKYLEDTKVEIYYNKNISFEEGRMWLYSGIEGIMYYYDDYYDEFIYDSFLEGKEYYYSFEEKRGIDVDKNSIIYQENAIGEIYYYDDDLIMRFIKPEDCGCFIDKNFRECFVEKDGTMYYVDSNNDLRYYRDDAGKYYFEENGKRYYEIEEFETKDDYYFIYIDEQGNKFYRDEFGQKIYDIQNLY